MNIIEISTKFPTDLSAINYFEKVRWGRKPKCAYCGSDKLSNRNKDYRYHCLTCNKTFSVTVNTHLHNTRLPLKTWLYAIGLICDAKKGLSAKQLERNLGITYKTVWNMYMNIRRLMTDGEYKLDEVVEMDDFCGW